MILADSLVHDELVIVAGHLVDGGLGPTVLVVSAGDFNALPTWPRTRASRSTRLEFGMRPRSDSHWLPWLVPSERMVERFGVPAEGIEEVAVERRPEWRSDIGFLGECEVTRLLAEAGNLNLFRPFPDSETAEIAILHLDSRRVVGLQVKTVDVGNARLRATVNVYASSFRASPTTYFVVLAWLRDEARFHEECLLFPSVQLLDFARDDGAGHIEFVFRPGSTAQGELDPYRRRLSDLRSEIERLLDVR